MNNPHSPHMKIYILFEKLLEIMLKYSDSFTQFNWCKNFRSKRYSWCKTGDKILDLVVLYGSGGWKDRCVSLCLLRRQTKVTENQMCVHVMRFDCCTAIANVLSWDVRFGFSDAVKEYIFSYIDVVSIRELERRNDRNISGRIPPKCGRIWLNFL